MKMSLLQTISSKGFEYLLEGDDNDWTLALVSREIKIIFKSILVVNKHVHVFFSHAHSM